MLDKRNLFFSGIIALSISCADKAQGPSPGDDDGPPDIIEDETFEGLPAFHPGPKSFRRLTNAQYANAISDVLGIEIDLTSLLNVDRMLGHYANGERQGDPDASFGQAYGKAASVAAAAALKSENRSRVFDDSRCGDGCLEAFVSDVGRMLFRRPVAAEVRDVLIEAARSAGTDQFWDQATVALEIMLQSIQFLYVFDEGSPDTGAPGFMKRDSFGIAERLAFALWNRGPDQELINAAEDSGFSTESKLNEQIRRMIDDPRFVQGGREFFREWLGYDFAAGASKADELEYTPELASALIAETDALVIHFLENRLPVMNLFSADFTFANEEVSAFYGGLDEHADVSGARRLPPERGGVLGHGSFIAANSGISLPSPTLRGLAVLEHLMCGAVASPPADAPDQLPEPDDSVPLTVRERTERFMLGNQQCQVCHEQMDNIGFLFEHFDVVGRFRNEEPVAAAPGGRKPIHAEGAIPFWEYEQVSGLGGLAEIMSSRREAADCFRKNLLERVLGRSAIDTDARTLAAIDLSMKEGEGDFAAAIRGLATSGALFYFASDGD